MNKKRELKLRVYTTNLHWRFGTSFLWTVLLAVCPSCILTGNSISNQETNPPTVKGQAIAQPTGQLSPRSFEYVELIDRSHWLVAESNRLLRTEDGGRNWTQMYMLTPPTDDGDKIQGLSFINERIGFLIVSGRILRTNDGGTNWTTLGSISPSEKIEFKNCRFTDSMRGWGVGMLWNDGWVNDPKIPRYVGIAFTTQDGGLTWQRRQLNLPEAYRPAGTYWSLNDVFFENAKTGWLVGDRGTIFRTGDGGETWHLATTQDVDYQGIGFLDDRHGWATYRYGNSSGGVAVTIDGGKRWKLLKESFVRGNWPVFAVFRSPEDGFAISLKLYETRDGGQQWKSLSGGDRVGDVAYRYLGQAKDGTMVALGFKGSILATLIHTDVGSTWHSND
jgi:photosystem II stability/assembly factor-like uncharacterized protein